MDFKNSLLKMAFGAFLLSTSLSASATDLGHHGLYIRNDTGFTLSFRADQICSSLMGDVTPNTHRKISAWTLHKVCDNCVVQIYASSHCSGPLLGQFHMVPKNSNVVFDAYSYVIGIGVGGGYGMLTVRDFRH